MCQGWVLNGTVGEISVAGVSVNIPGTVDLAGEEGTLYVDSIALKVRRQWAMQCDDVVLAGFTIEHVYKGTDQWQKLTSLAA